MFQSLLTSKTNSSEISQMSEPSAHDNPKHRGERVGNDLEMLESLETSEVLELCMCFDNCRKVSSQDMGLLDVGGSIPY